jgi:hypothetical protein
VSFSIVSRDLSSFTAFSACCSGVAMTTLCPGA